MPDVLVTGSGGFIGRALCEALAARGHRVAPLARRDGDIADPLTLRDRARVDHVFHLAGRTFVPESWTDPQGFLRDNVVGTTNVLEFCRRHGARLTFVSAYVYGTPMRLPVSEDCRPRPNNPYAISKYLAEEVCEFYHNHHGVDVMVLRPFNIFGPGQKPQFLIPHVLRCIAAGEPIRVKDLEPRRDYLHLDDAVAALLATLRGPRGSHVVNLGSGASVSVAELIAAMQEVAGTTLPVVSARDVRPNELADVYADIRRAREVLAWAPALSLRQGLQLLFAGEHA